MPGEWFQRDDWSPVYYNKADSAGLGFDRSPTGSNFVAQYFPPLAAALREHRHDAGEPADVVPPRAVGPAMSSGRAVLGRARLPLPDGRAVRDLDARDVGDAAAVRRRAPVRRGQGQARAARGRRRELARRERQLLARVQRPSEPGRRRAAVGTITVGGQRARRLRPLRGAYTIPVARARRRRSRRARDRRRAREIVSQAQSVPGQAVVKVTKDDFFGPLVKNYVFNLVPDTTLASLRVNGKALTLQAGRDDLQRAARAAATRSSPGRGGRERPGRDGQRRAGGERHRAGDGHGHQRRRVDRLHGRLGHADHGQRRVRRRSARSGSVVRPDDGPRAGRRDGALVITLAGRRPAGQHEHGAQPRAAGRQRRLDGGVQARRSRARWPTTTSRAGSSPTPTTTTT